MLLQALGAPIGALGPVSGLLDGPEVTTGSLGLVLAGLAFGLLVGGIVGCRLTSRPASAWVLVTTMLLAVGGVLLTGTAAIWAAALAGLVLAGVGIGARAVVSIVAFAKPDAPRSDDDDPHRGWFSPGVDTLLSAALVAVAVGYGMGAYVPFYTGQWLFVVLVVAFALHLPAIGHRWHPLPGRTQTDSLRSPEPWLLVALAFAGALMLGLGYVWALSHVSVSFGPDLDDVDTLTIALGSLFVGHLVGHSTIKLERGQAGIPTWLAPVVHALFGLAGAPVVLIAPTLAKGSDLTGGIEFAMLGFFGIGVAGAGVLAMARTTAGVRHGYQSRVTALVTLASFAGLVSAVAPFQLLVDELDASVTGGVLIIGVSLAIGFLCRRVFRDGVDLPPSAPTPTVHEDEEH